MFSHFEWSGQNGLFRWTQLIQLAVALFCAGTCSQCLTASYTTLTRTLNLVIKTVFVWKPDSQSNQSAAFVPLTGVEWLDSIINWFLIIHSLQSSLHGESMQRIHFVQHLSQRTLQSLGYTSWEHWFHNKASQLYAQDQVHSFPHWTWQDLCVHDLQD